MNLIKTNLNCYKKGKKAFEANSFKSSKTRNEPPFQIISWFTAPLILTAYNNDNNKLFGLAGNAVSGGLEKLVEATPAVSTAYIINSTTPLSATGDGTNSLPVEITNAVVASPTISGYPLLDFTFSAAGTVDFSNVKDVKNISISNSTAGASITNLANDIEKIFVSDTQSGDWITSFKPNNSGTLYFDWTNNTGSSVDLTSLTINEVSILALKNSGNEPITIPLLNLDPEDTQRIEIGNDNDGNIIIAAATDLTGTSGLKTISLTTWNDGDIILGTPGTSGLPDLQQLVSVALIASKTGAITLGDLGKITAINNIANFSIDTQGSAINIGSVDAKKIDNITASGAEFSSINFGNMTIEESIGNIILNGNSKFTIGTIGAKKIDAITATNFSSVNLGNMTIGESIGNITLNGDGNSTIGTIGAKKISNITASVKEFSSIAMGNFTIEEEISNFTLNGEGNVTLGTFSGDGTIKINASGMSKKGINLDFSSLTGSVDITTTNQDDNISLGVAAGKVISGSGDDIISIVANATGNADIRSGDGIDIITLSSQKGTDLVQPGGTNISTIAGDATTHATILADKIINFDPTSDRISFGSITASATNFLSESGASSFSDALTKSNTAMASGKKYYFSYNVASATDGFGLLFYDSDGNGSSDTFVSLTGITTNTITFDHLVIA